MARRTTPSSWICTHSYVAHDDLRRRGRGRSLIESRDWAVARGQAVGEVERLFVDAASAPSFRQVVALDDRPPFPALASSSTPRRTARSTTTVQRPSRRSLSCDDDYCTAAWWGGGDAREFLGLACEWMGKQAPIADVLAPKKPNIAALRESAK